MKHQLILFLLTVIFSLGFVSCENNNDEDVYVPIKSVKAIASTSLNKRADWNFYVNENIYKSTVNGRTIHASIKSEKETTYFIVDSDGKVSLSTLSNMTTVWMLFASPKYNLLKKNSVATSELLDQSTSDKQMLVDALSVNHPSYVTPHIENVKLEHSHSLINYTIEGLPVDAKVRLMSNSVEISPLVVDEVYSAILINPHLASVQVQVGDEVHEISLATALSNFTVGVRGIKDVHYSLVFRYTAEAEDDKKLIVEDLTSQKWSEEELSKGKVFY